MPVSEVNAKIGLPGGMAEIGGTWVPGDQERVAAWEMYVELVTRVSVVELKPTDGLVREALSSLHSLFDTTRTILRSHGPDVAVAQSGSVVSFGHLAVTVLNQIVRPFLAEWHPRLCEYEARRPDGTSQQAWEQAWDKNAEVRGALNDVRTSLISYTGILGEICGAKGMLTLSVIGGND